MITGKLFLRKTLKVIDGRHCYILAGVVAMDTESQPEMLYVVTGKEGSDDDKMQMLLSSPHAPDIDVETLRIDQILMERIWQV